MNTATVHTVDLRHAVSMQRRIPAASSQLATSLVRLHFVGGKLEVSVASTTSSHTEVIALTNIIPPLNHSAPPAFHEPVHVSRKDLAELTKASDLKQPITFALTSEKKPKLIARFRSKGFATERTLLIHDERLLALDFGDSHRTAALSSSNVQDLAQSMEFSSKDTTRAVICGAHLSTEGTGRLVSTDGRRLFITPFAKPPTDINIPNEALHALKHKGFEGPMKLTVGVSKGFGHAIRLSNLTTRLEFRENYGNYPKFQQVIPNPDATTGTYVLSPATATRLVEWMKAAKDHTVTLTRNPQGLKISASIVKDGSVSNFGSIEVRAAVLGKPAKQIGFNANFLGPALAAGFLSIDTTDHDGACPAVGRKGLSKMVLMPMRIQDPSIDPPEASSTQQKKEREAAKA